MPPTHSPTACGFSWLEEPGAGLPGLNAGFPSRPGEPFASEDRDKFRFANHYSRRDLARLLPICCNEESLQGFSNKFMVPFPQISNGNRTGAHTGEE